MAVNGHKRTMQVQKEGFLVLSALTWCLLVRPRGWQREEWGGPLYNFRLKRITLLSNLLSLPKFMSTFSNSVFLLKFSSVFSSRAYLFQTRLRGKLNRDEGVIWEGGGGGGRLFTLAKTVVSVLDKELESKVNKLKYKKLEAIQPRIKKKSGLPTSE